MENIIYNKVLFQGSIDEISFSKTQATIVMGIKEGKGITNRPEILFQGSVKEDLKKFKQGQQVRVHAVIKTYRTTKKEARAERSFFATKIEPAPTMIEELIGERMGNRFNNYSKAIVSGYLIKSIALKNFASMMIESQYVAVSGEIKKAYIQVVYPCKTPEKFIQTLNKGDYICGTGRIQTYGKNVSTGTVKMTDIVLVDISVRSKEV